MMEGFRGKTLRADTFSPCYGEAENRLCGKTLWALGETACELLEDIGCKITALFN